MSKLVGQNSVKMLMCKLQVMQNWGGKWLVHDPAGCNATLLRKFCSRQVWTCWDWVLGCQMDVPTVGMSCRGNLNIRDCWVPWVLIGLETNLIGSLLLGHFRRQDLLQECPWCRLWTDSGGMVSITGWWSLLWVVAKLCFVMIEEFSFVFCEEETGRWGAWKLWVGERLGTRRTG